MPFFTIIFDQDIVFRLTYKEGGLAGGYGMVGMLVAYEDDIQENRSPKALGSRALDMGSGAAILLSHTVQSRTKKPAT